MESTYHTSFKYADFKEAADAIDLMSQYCGAVTGSLFKDIYVKKMAPSQAKSNLVALGFSRRNAHSLLTYVQGSVDGWKENLENSIETLERKIFYVQAEQKNLDQTKKKYRKVYFALSRKILLAATCGQRKTCLNGHSKVMYWQS
jgi:hypothetical protein